MSLSTLLLCSATSAIHHGHVVDRAARTQSLILTALPSAAADEALPSTFDWRNVDGKNFVTADVNQHIPIYCGSCWIHGTLAALNDRIKIARNAAFPDVMLSRQAAMNCVPLLSAPDMPPPGCNGGDPWSIHHYMSKHPLPDESCQPYEAKNGMCNAEGQCRNCFHPMMVADPTTPKVEYSSPGTRRGFKPAIPRLRVIRGSLTLAPHCVQVAGPCPSSATKSPSTAASRARSPCSARS